jgi:hypothetical protein
MFRPATIKEVECLLRSCGKELVRPPSAARPHPNPDGGGGVGVAQSADKVRGDHGSLLAAGCSPIVVVEYHVCAGTLSAGPSSIRHRDDLRRGTAKAHATRGVI